MTMQVSDDTHHKSTPSPTTSSSPLVKSKSAASHILHTPIESPTTITSPRRTADHHHATTSSGGDPSSSGTSSGPRRRQSRFDPKAREDDAEDEGYGELASRHPLRRVPEESPKDSNEVHLPGVKALFGTLPALADHPPTPSTSQSLFYAPSLPSLRPDSPSSPPSTARTSAYGSFASTSSGADQYPISGWWAPGYDHYGAHPGSAPSSAGGPGSAGPSSQRPSWSSISPRHSQSRDRGSFSREVTIQTSMSASFLDEHSDKRRRSDQPVTRNGEEASKIRWVAQNRNASYPTSSPVAPSPVPSSLRTMMHPPPATSTGTGTAPPHLSEPMTLSGIGTGLHGTLLPSSSSANTTPLTPHHEYDEYPFDHRPAVIRTGSIVGGQLAQSFEGLTASERSPRGEMGPPGPPSSVDRRWSGSGRPGSGTPTMTSYTHSPAHDTLQVPRSSSSGILSPRSAPSPGGYSAGPPSGAGGLVTPTHPSRPLTASPQPPPMSAPPPRRPGSEAGRTRTGSTFFIETSSSRRQSSYQSSSPETSTTPLIRRSSLSELIRSKTGDDLAMAQGRYTDRPSPRGGVSRSSEPSIGLPSPSPHDSFSAQPLDRPSLSDTGIVLTGWPGPAHRASEQYPQPPHVHPHTHTQPPPHPQARPPHPSVPPHAQPYPYSGSYPPDYPHGRPLDHGRPQYVGAKVEFSSPPPSFSRRGRKRSISDRSDAMAIDPPLPHSHLRPLHTHAAPVGAPVPGHGQGPRDVDMEMGHRGDTTATPTPTSGTAPAGGLAGDGMRGMDILAESARRVSEAEAARDISSTSTSPSTSNVHRSRRYSSPPPKPSVGPSGAAAPPRTAGLGPRYPCDYCAKTFSRPSSLKIHRFSHTGERPFTCKEPGCGRSFSVQSNLKRHAKVHLTSSPGRPPGSGSSGAGGPGSMSRHRTGSGGSGVHPPRSVSGGTYLSPEGPGLSMRERRVEEEEGDEEDGEEDDPEGDDDEDDPEDEDEEEDELELEDELIDDEEGEGERDGGHNEAQNR